MRGLEGIARKQLSGVSPVYLEVDLAPGAWVEPSRVAAIVTKAGYHVRKDDTWVTATGALRMTEKQPTLELLDKRRQGGNVAIMLIRSKSRSGSESHAFSDAEKLGSESVAGRVRVTGRWRESGTQPGFAIELTGIEPQQ